MKKIGLICLILFFSVWCLAQEEGAPATTEESVPTEQPPAVDVPSTDSTSPPPLGKLPKPLGRVKTQTDPNNTSSSFMGDSDSLDPLNANRDNLKDDEEPVLDDIKQVLEAPKKPKEPKKKKVEEPPPPEIADVPPSPPPPPVEIVESAPPKKLKKEKKQKPPPPKPGRNSDDPDLALEKQFNKIYTTYNIKPTSEDAWAEASSRQTEQQYTVQSGDTLWSISSILFGDPNFWPKLWALNKQGILNPHFILPGAIIYFYTGDAQNSPTLSLTKKVKTEAVIENPSEVEYAEGEKATVIPPSLPAAESARYKLSKENKRTNLKIELGTFPKFNSEPSNNLYLTDAPVNSTVFIQVPEITKFRCYEGRLLKDIRFKGPLVENYEVFEPLDTLKTSVGTMHVYRAYGGAQPYQSKYLKLTDCKGLIATNLVFLPRGQMDQLKSQKMSATTAPVLIGGPDVVAQNLFALNQIAYVDFGSFPFQTGQEYKTLSQVTDVINGQIRVLEKYGSYAVVLVQNVNDILEVGDKIITTGL